MRVMAIQGSFGTDNLKPDERPKPEPGAGEVLLRMKAAALNFRDLMMVNGLYNPKQPLPLIPCSDGVGEVVATGDGVTRCKVGERVATLFFQNWFSGIMTREKLFSALGGPLDGALTEYMLLKEDGVIAVPEHLSDEQAATLPCAALTAWNALVSRGGIKAGDTVLTLGTGGVSIFALQFARLLGARVIVTSSSSAKLARAAELGAWQGVNYRETPKWAKKVKELTDGRGVDHIIEVGGSETIKQSLMAIRPGGHISLIGVLSGTITDLNLIPVLMQGIRIQGILVGPREDFEAMNRAIAAHKMEPVVDCVLDYQEAGAALQQMASAQHFGKICLRIGD